jgi:hypothetical protein
MSAWGDLGRALFRGGLSAVAPAPHTKNRSLARNATGQPLEHTRPRAAQAGTVVADVVQYLAKWGTAKHPRTVGQRGRHLRLFAQMFGPRLWATLTAQEIEAQLGDGMAAREPTRRLIVSEHRVFPAYRRHAPGGQRSWRQPV